MSETTGDAIVVPQNFKRFDIPVKMGIIIGIVSSILNTANFMFLLPANFIAFSVFIFIISFACVLLYGVTGAQQRRAIGGFINIKDAFQAIFIAILISTAISSIWGLVYAKYIDPEIGQKLKAGTLAFMEKFNVPQDKLDEASRSLDEQLQESMRFSAILYSYAKSLIVYSIFGFICALIVRRSPAVTMR
jgi:uncharacterized membrane protein YvlD (DUF360 family)